MKSYFIPITATSLVIFSVIYLPSCSSEDASDLSNHKADAKSIVYQERKSPIPKMPQSLVHKEERLRYLGADAPNLNIYPYNTLGAICRVGNGFIGHPMNIGNTGVIDIQSILNDKLTSRFLFHRPMDATESTLDIYHTQDELSKSVLKTRKITAGFQLNLGLFSIGKQGTYTSTFHSNLNESKKHTWAEFNLLHYANRVGLETTDAALRTIAYRNMDDLFLYSIYSFPIANYIREKGFLVVTNFFTGGRLTAMMDYSQESSSNTTSDTKGVDISIKAAFGWGKATSGTSSNQGSPQGTDGSLKKTNNISLTFGYGTSSGNSQSSTNQQEKIYAHIQAFGGAKANNIPLAPLDLKNNTIDVSSWYNSLSDSRTHQYIDIDDGGLVSIDKFMLETNFRHRVSATLGDNTWHPSSLLVPSINLMEWDDDGSSFDSRGMYLVPVLQTRQGDYIILRNSVIKMSKQEWNEVEYKILAKSSTRELSNVFTCRITGQQGPVRWLDSYHAELFSNDLWVYTSFNIKSNNIYKFKNPRTSIWYIYDSQSRSAFSFYDNPDDEDDDTYVTDLYGITEWFERLPEKRISMQDLATNYNIIGL